MVGANGALLIFSTECINTVIEVTYVQDSADVTTTQALLFYNGFGCQL